MCGIHGFSWNNENKIQRMIKVSNHRGPDGRGYWCDDFISLGHNLLAIMDDSKVSAQPWVTERGVLVFNGEIYNYKELARQYGYDLKTNTDTEVLCHLLETKGNKILHELDGMFALAFYDRDKKTLILARDSNGAKPLYYGFKKDKIIFSSEIKSMLEMDFDRVVSKEGFKHYYYSGVLAGPLTLFHGISKLVPGEILILDLFKNKVIKTDNINNHIRYKLDFLPHRKALQKRLRENLRKSVQATLMGQRKNGLLLSGGLDSSAILFEIYSSGLKIDTFSTKYDIDSYNEDAIFAKKLAAQYYCPHHSIKITEELWIEALEESLFYLEQPIQNRSIPSYFLTYKFLAENGVVVSISGDGGDELFLGYKHYITNSSFRDRLRRVKPKKPLLKYSNNVNYSIKYFLNWFPQKVLSGDKYNDMMYADSLFFLAEDYLMRNDKLGMAHSIEGRFPFLRDGVRNFIRSVPGRHKLNEKFQDLPLSSNKTIMRNAYKEFLPSFIINKKKTGWRSPTEEWILGEKHHFLREYIKETLSDPEIQNIFEITDYDVDIRYLSNAPLVKSQKSNKMLSSGASSQKELFTVLMFSVWYKKFGMRF